MYADIEDTDTLESSPLRHVPPEDQEWHRQQERVPLSCVSILTLKVPITTAADDIHKYFFIVFQRK